MHASLSLALVCTFVSLFAFSTLKAEAEEGAKDTRCYEMRIYHAAEGKLDALNARFRDHTCKLFEKHGITNIGYWMPLENPDRLLIYVIAFPSREAHDAAWQAFVNDPDWKAAFAASETAGKLVTQVEQTFLHATDYSPAIKPMADATPRVFELRTYTTTPGHLPNLNARFREHTQALFTQHGMTNFAYWNLDETQPASKNADAKHADPANTLVYILAHKSKESAEENFKAFRADPVWIAAKEASEKAAGGSLTIAQPDGVKSVFMAPTDYSPTK